MTFCRTMVEFWLTNLEKQKLPTGLPAGPRSLPPHFGPFYPQVDRFFANKISLDERRTTEEHLDAQCPS